MIKTASIGVAQYTISPTEPDTITVVYISTTSVTLGPPVVCTGRAKGDTSSGFPGCRSITFWGPDGEMSGTFDWEIEKIGDTFQLLWRMQKGGIPYVPGKEGMPVLQGIGIANSATSIIVTYWMTPEIIAEMGIT